MKNGINKISAYGDSILKGAVTGTDSGHLFDIIEDSSLVLASKALGFDLNNQSVFGSIVSKTQRRLNRDIEKGIFSDLAIIESGGNDCDYDWTQVSSSPDEKHLPRTTLEDFIQNIAVHATSINDLLTSIYYPLGLYINLITKFNILDLINLFVVNIIPFILFIMIGSKLYFYIIFNSKESKVAKNNKINKKIIIKRKPITSLVKKELKRYFSSPVYMFNTSFGLLLSVIVSIYLCWKGPNIFDKVLLTS